MDDAVWGGKVGSSFGETTQVMWEVEFTNSAPVTRRANFTIRGGYIDAHVAAALLEAWNTNNAPEFSVVADGPKVSFPGRVTRMTFTVGTNPPQNVPSGGGAIEVVPDLVVFRR
jgi:hypothetical protein